MNKVLNLFILLTFQSCTQHSPKPMATKKNLEFKEIVWVHDFLNKTLDKDKNKAVCLESDSEIELLLRTIVPSYEEASDYYQTLLDDDSEIKSLISNCIRDCNCQFIEELLRENEIELDKKSRSILQENLKSKRYKECTDQKIKEFCQSAIYQKIDSEKEQFKFDE